MFYYKLQADYHRYQCEYEIGDRRKAAAKAALLAYKQGQALAEASMRTTDALRLGLALNFAVFYHDVLRATDWAIVIAKTVRVGAGRTSHGSSCRCACSRGGGAGLFSGRWSSAVWCDAARRGAAQLAHPNPRRPRSRRPLTTGRQT